MGSSARRLMMPEVPEGLFVEGVLTAVKRNIEFVPPYGTGSSLYIRPLLLGTGPCVGLKPSKEYTFLVLVTPVGDYYKAGSRGVSAMIMVSYPPLSPTPQISPTSSSSSSFSSSSFSSLISPPPLSPLLK